ncbi:M14 family metallopeptidase [Spongiimicrobium sp. 3-5]|uniref:M14 family metallopeptidase n=1 Tax=Spongiimicrobium sp. 3-5 TaxID=3332596 RepID=UPI00397FCBEE
MIISIKKHAFLIGLTILVCCCGQNNENEGREVVFDTSFAGARLNRIQKIEENRYMGFIFPENEPINKSPWFAFGVSSIKEKEIELLLNYCDYKHRYIPKLSTDRTTWKTIEASRIKVDTTTGIATLRLSVSPKPLYVAAQEIETTKDTYRWMQGFLEKNPGIKKEMAGKTALNNDNYVLIQEHEDVKNTLVLVARQHPPEIPGGTIGFKSFFETIFSDTQLATEFRTNFNIYTFPLLNPDGVDAGNWRHNANGVDLNRDWISFSQPETQMVKKFMSEKIQKGQKIRYAIDFHTSHSGPYLLVLDAINEAKTHKVTPQWIQNIQAMTNIEVDARKRSQELPYCYNYFFNELGAEAVTYEDGDEIDREVIKSRAKVYAEELMKVLLNKIKDGSFEN